jgi:(E)-4-hydroxy-3-methylbut-2-enyl-diphosphate synthase
MGCQVNGPGEAKHSDIAITGLGTKVFLYKHGVLARK